MPLSTIKNVKEIYEVDKFMFDKLSTNFKKKHSNMVVPGIPAKDVSMMVQLKNKVEKSITTQGKNIML